MITHQLTQGSPEWLAYRAQHFNASDAPAMMGCSPYKTRAELLRELHTGVAAEVDVGTQKRFDNGHRAEALARPLAEEVIGEELYPVTGSLGRLSASFDGLTMDDRQGFEHKALNADLRAAFRAMVDMGAPENLAAFGRLLPIYHRVQMEQQLLVSGAERILFMASQWADDGELIEERHCWYYPDATLRQQIVDGWAQFERDLAAYVLPAPAAEPARAEPMESLPTVSVRLDGALTVAGNLPSFAVALREFVSKIPAKPATDTEFATTEAACKALKKAEEALDAAEAGALASISDVDAMRRAVADCRKLARDTRLAAEKMVERRKVEIKEAAVMAARRALDEHIAQLNAEIAPMRLPAIAADFAGAIKGLKSVASMQDKLDGLLATAKIAADADARAIRANLAAFQALALDQDFGHLFHDLGQIVHKAADDFAAVVRSRIAEHQQREQAREAKRQAEEAARIAAAEQRAREQEAARIAAQQAEDARVAALARQREEDAAAESARVAAAALATAAAPPPAPSVAPPAPAVPVSAASFPPPAASVAAPRADEPATLTLGVICERLGVTVRAEFLADTLHVKPAATPIKGCGLYTETQFATICRQLVSHVSAMAELYAGETA